MKTIAFDVMGNDNGVRAAVEATVEFVDNNYDYRVFLVGDATEINSFLKETERIKIIDVKEVVDKTKGAREARKGGSSMAVAINLVKEGKADVVISSGDSGIYLSMATLTLRRISGVKRPAFMPVFPTVIPEKKFVMMDVGANLETTSEMLQQWALIGSIFSQEVLGEKSPKVSMVNIGTEDNKGHAFHQEANVALKESELNYQGFVEPRDLLHGVTEVAVVDGYAGNMILKTMEGTVLSLLSLIKKEIKSKFKYKIGGFLAKGAFKNVAKQLDYRNVGAAWIMGLNSLAIKCHGGADKKSYLGAFNQILNVIESEFTNKMKEAFK